MSKEYLISKLSFRNNEQLIETVKIALLEGNSVSAFETKDRVWIERQFNAGHTIRGVYKNTNGKWFRKNAFRLEDGCFKWG